MLTQRLWNGPNFNSTTCVFEAALLSGHPIGVLIYPKVLCVGCGCGLLLLVSCFPVWDCGTFIALSAGVLILRQLCEALLGC